MDYVRSDKVPVDLVSFCADIKSKVVKLENGGLQILSG